jgi:hypothetical protein
MKHKLSDVYACVCVCIHTHTYIYIYKKKGAYNQKLLPKMIVLTNITFLNAPSRKFPYNAHTHLILGITNRAKLKCSTWLSPLWCDSYHFQTHSFCNTYSQLDHFILILLLWNLITRSQEAYKNIPYWMDPQFPLLYRSLSKELV